MPSKDQIYQAVFQKLQESPDTRLLSDFQRSELAACLTNRICEMGLSLPEAAELVAGSN